MHRTRNAAYGQPYRGFESLPLRQHKRFFGHFLKVFLPTYKCTYDTAYAGRKACAASFSGLVGPPTTCLARTNAPASLAGSGGGRVFQFVQGRR